LTLDAAATPELVRRIAAMFEDTLSQIEPERREGDVTMRVENYHAIGEVRGWHEGGERTVRLAAELVENPTEAVQQHEHLAAAARTLAAHASALTVYHPVFWRGRRRLRPVDDIFVRTMRAAGQSTTSRREGRLSGETVVYTPILRVGRAVEGGRLQARVRIEGRPAEVAVNEDLVAHVWEVAKSGQTVPVRLRGQWVESDSGDLHLDHPEIVGLDMTFDAWTGRDLLADAKQHAALFSGDDFERMLTDLLPARDE
jgi:hypothetical protein